MDTLYLVFKHQFQICLWIALQTIKLRPKQTETLTYGVHSVKARSQLLLEFLSKKQKPRPSRITHEEMRHFSVPLETRDFSSSLSKNEITKTSGFLSRAFQNTSFKHHSQNIVLSALCIVLSALCEGELDDRLRCAIAPMSLLSL
jgi:hypothetical protein